jgi:hypothetical protein
MDREQQAERIRKVIDSIAEGALALPPEARLTFIKSEIVKVQGDFLRTYEADPRLAALAGEFVDGIDSQVKARLTFFETKGKLWNSMAQFYTLMIKRDLFGRAVWYAITTEQNQRARARGGVGR